MTCRYLMTKKDPRHTDFVFLDDHAGAGAGVVTANGRVYTTDTTYYSYPRNGSRATTTITRADPGGDRLQVGIIEWPVRPQDQVPLAVGTRHVSMTKTGLYTSPEQFRAADGYVYEWQIQDGRPQLVPFRSYNPISNAYVATFLRSHSGLCLWRKRNSSLFISPEGSHILDDIIVTFVYFESKWRDKENTKSHASLSGSML